MRYGKIALVTLCVLAALQSRVEAQNLLIDPTGGTSITFADPDDGSTQRSLGGTYNIYGSNVTSLFLQADGFLATGDSSGFLVDRSITTLANATGFRVIAPLYDDLYLDIGNTVRESVGSTYYAATFDIDGYLSTSTTQDSIFQAALFNATTTLRGNTFQAGDIVFSYAKFNHILDGTFTVGVAQNNTNGTAAFGGSNGQFSSFAAFNSNFNFNTQAILFRYNAANNTYAQSLVTYGTLAPPVPEPGSVALLVGVVTVGAGFLRKRRARA